MKNMITRVKADFGKVEKLKGVALATLLAVLSASPVYAIDFGGGDAFLADGIEILAWLIGGVGAVFIAMGLFAFFIGVSNDNASGKSTGLQQLLGGCGIIAVGVLVGVGIPAFLF